MNVSEIIKKMELIDRIEELEKENKDLKEKIRILQPWMICIERLIIEIADIVIFKGEIIKNRANKDIENEKFIVIKIKNEYKEYSDIQDEVYQKIEKMKCKNILFI